MTSRCCFIAVIFALLPAAAGAASPMGWGLSGSDPGAYVMSRDLVVTHAGKPSGCLASVRKTEGFGTMAQCVDPAAYAGKRVRFSGYVRAREVKGWAGLWMRVDGPHKICAFDNMRARAVRGTKDWTRCDVVLDVAPEATNICFGILLAGEGKVWLSGVKFEVVNQSVPTTSKGVYERRKPTNLGFER
jgi:hypothetical protein